MALFFLFYFSLFLVSVDANVSVVHGGGVVVRGSLSAEISMKTTVTLLGRIKIL